MRHRRAQLVHEGESLRPDRVNNKHFIIDHLQVSFFQSWINCVVSAALETGGVRAEVEERCSKVAESLVPDCLDTKELMFGLDSLNTIDDSFPIQRCDQ